jgi:hypothetical protein
MPGNLFLNCNSPLDQKWLDARPKNDEAIDEKTAKRRTGNSDPDSAVMAQFLALGLIDLVNVKQPTAELQRGTFATEGRARNVDPDQLNAAAQHTWGVLQRKWRTLSGGLDLITDQAHPVGFWRRVIKETHGIDLPNRL